MNTVFIILGLFFLISLYININLFIKIEKQEETLLSYQFYLQKFSKIIEFSNTKLKELDSKGSFKSDDEVGFFFTELQKIQSLLNDFNVIEYDSKQKEILDR